MKLSSLERHVIENSHIALDYGLGNIFVAKRTQ